MVLFAMGVLAILAIVVGYLVQGRRCSTRAAASRCSSPTSRQKT